MTAQNQFICRRKWDTDTFPFPYINMSLYLLSKVGQKYTFIVARIQNTSLKRDDLTVFQIIFREIFDLVFLSLYIGYRSFGGRGRSEAARWRGFGNFNRGGRRIRGEYQDCTTLSKDKPLAFNTIQIVYRIYECSTVQVVHHTVLQLGEYYNCTKVVLGLYSTISRVS